MALVDSALPTLHLQHALENLSLATHQFSNRTRGTTSNIAEFHDIFKSYFRTAEQGADSLIWLAFSDEATLSEELVSKRAVARKRLWWAGTVASQVEWALGIKLRKKKLAAKGELQIKCQKN